MNDGTISEMHISMAGQAKHANPTIALGRAWESICRNHPPLPLVSIFDTSLSLGVFGSLNVNARLGWGALSTPKIYMLF